MIVRYVAPPPKSTTVRSSSRITVSSSIMSDSLAVFDLYPSALAHRNLGRIPDVMHLQLLAKTGRERFLFANRFGERMPHLRDGESGAAVFDAADAIVVLRGFDLVKVALKELRRSRVRGELFDLGARAENAQLARVRVAFDGVPVSAILHPEHEHAFGAVHLKSPAGSVPAGQGHLQRSHHWPEAHQQIDVVDLAIAQRRRAVERR